MGKKSSFIKSEEAKLCPIRERDVLKGKLEELSRRLEEELRRGELILSTVKALKGNIRRAIEEKKFNIVVELLDVLRKALEVMLDGSYFPHQEVLIKAFSKVLEVGIDIKGEVSIRVNPTDLELDDKLSLQILEGKSLPSFG